MPKRDYYDVLEVSRQASRQEIRRAYRRLARQYSPDVNLWDARATDLFDEIAEAYRILTDPVARALYDRLGHRAFEPGPADPTAQTGRGDDLHVPIEIEFEQALRGVSTTIEITRLEPCVACSGTGGAGGRFATRCPACGGRPIRIVVDRDVPVPVGCEACGASGWHLPDPCPACVGRGTAPRRVRITVDVPPGVDTGAQIRLPADGHAAPAPGQRGDLVVITRVRPHRFFSRKGDNLYCEVPLTVPEAALGARIQVPTPDGPAMVTIPAGTQSGQIFRIRGKGCPRLDRDGRGDLFVVARVTIPRNADATLEEVLRALQRLWPENPRAELWGRSGGER